MNKKYVVGIIVLLIVGVILIRQSRSREEIINGTDTTSSTQAVASSSQNASTTSPKVSQNYAAAVNLYTTRRIQFNDTCQAIPSTISLKNKTNVMFDNRSSSTKVLSIDGVKYTIKGLDFKIIPLASKVLPHTVQVNCGTGKNNAQITLQ